MKISVGVVLLDSDDSIKFSDRIQKKVSSPYLDSTQAYSDLSLWFSLYVC